MKKFFSLSLFALAATFANALGFADITNWTGTGANQSALVIDWNDGRADSSVVWGYRWDGSATGEQMLRAIVDANRDLYIKVSEPTQFGVILFGAGLDRDHDGFGISSGQPFINGVAVADYDSADGSTAIDSNDSYREGWNTGYWSYWGAEGNGILPTASEWSYPGAGMTDRLLRNGSWDGWSFDDFSGTYESTPSVPTPAAPVPEPMTLGALTVGLLAFARRRHK